MTKQLYLIRGASGAGKSTLVESLMKDKPHAIALSADDWMIKKGKYEYNRKKLPIVHRICLEQTEKKMWGYAGLDFGRSGWQDIFVHNTFTTNAELKPYYELAEKYGYEVFSMVVENRHKGESIHDVPEETLKAQKKRFQLKL
jgi:predicted kinase